MKISHWLDKGVTKGLWSFAWRFQLLGLGIAAVIVGAVFLICGVS